MSDFSSVLSVINALSLILGGLLLRNYLSTYLSEKGKNIASKEDLEHITDLVEGVKSDYSLILEKHKAGLARQAQVLEKRRKVYEDICSALRVFIDGHGNSDEAKERFHAAYAAAWLWSSDDVLSSLNSLIELLVQRSNSPGSVAESLLKQKHAEIIIGMRRDVGFQETTVTPSQYHFVRF